MSTTVISIEASNLITLTEAKKHLRILHTREDDYITSLIPVVSQMVEEAIDRTIAGKSLRLSSMKNSLYYLGDYNIQSVDSVKLYSEGELVANTDAYILKGKTLELNDSTDYDSIEIEFTVTTDYPIIPTAFKQAALLLLADFFNTRQEFVMGRSVFNTNAVMRLLRPYTKYLTL
tara:strand:+ start:102 stop:626 length:525 start_codon:yes stop_codon:yes gene_type:complete